MSSTIVSNEMVPSSIVSLNAIFPTWLDSQGQQVKLLVIDFCTGLFQQFIFVLSKCGVFHWNFLNQVVGAVTVQTENIQNIKIEKLTNELYNE